MPFAAALRPLRRLLALAGLSAFGGGEGVLVEVGMALNPDFEHDVRTGAGDAEQDISRF